MAVIAVIATLDTKGAEAAFLKESIQVSGHTALLIDSGIGSDPAVEPDVSRETVFQAAGIEDYRAYLSEQGKAATQAAVCRGLKLILQELQKTGRIQGVLSVGGAQGTALSTEAMQALPIGFPKVMVSTVACGSARFGDYVGNRDVTMIPSIVDICGLNSITIPIFTSACGAVVGMAEAAGRGLTEGSRPVVAMTMAGVTTPCVMRVKELLEAKGFETIICHTNVSGSIVVDEMASQGKIQAVLDIATHEWGGYVFDGLMKCGEDRFTYIYNSDIPLISLPGCIDVMLKGPVDTLDPELKKRVHYAHTPFHTHVRTNREEMYAVGKLLAEKHGKCRGKNAIMVPLKGYSMQNRAGHTFFDPWANEGFLEGVRENIHETTALVSCDCHINDPECADAIVALLETYIGGTE